MKAWPLLIGIIFILSFIYTPTFAISESELLSYYQQKTWEDTGHWEGPPREDFEDFPPCGNCDNSTSFQKAKPYIPTTTPTPQLPSWFVPSPSSDTCFPTNIWPTTPTPIPQLPSWFVPSPSSDTYSPINIWPTTPTPPSQLPSWFVPSPSVKPCDDSSFNQPSVDWKTEDDKIANYVAQKGNRFIWESTDPDVVIFNDIGVGKPNIYLYSDLDLMAQVRLTPEEDITISEPMYQPGEGWQAEIRNGSLNGNGDFLFYEGMVPDSGWQKEQGYVIRADCREEDMTFMLGQYNFNEKETVEFIEYWSQHLAEDVDYVFYPQETGVVDQVMPLNISPEPDHVMRIWFYAEPFVSAPQPVTSPETIVREGFYVVEWGVIIKDKYRI